MEWQRCMRRSIEEQTEIKKYGKEKEKRSLTRERYEKIQKSNS